MLNSPWTAADIASQAGKTFLITGANSGLGFASSRALARAGARVIMACRSLERGEAARSAIINEFPKAQLHLQHLDLASLASISAFASAIRKEYDQLHVLINNAGLNRFRRYETADGFEQTFGVNHLGHFALTARLFPLLDQTPGSRVVTVSSAAHLHATLEFDDLMSEKSYRMMRAYRRSKLANLLFARELQRRLEATDRNMLSLAVHPGLVATHMFTRFGDNFLPLRIMLRALSALVLDPDQGARPLVYAATAPGVVGGSYLVPNPHGYPLPGYSSSASRDPDLARQLWGISEELTGLSLL
jgi:NAD(P)-dependent dehydrogenase (short-subunit alcohol dehydrogenase family)